MNLFLKYFITILLISFSLPNVAQLDNASSGKTNDKNPIGIILPPARNMMQPETIGFGNNDGFKTAQQNENKKLQQKQNEENLKYKGILTKEKLAEESFSKNFKPINGQYPIVNQNLGTFRSDSKFVKIYCRDFQYPDNDRVTVYVNGEPVVYNIVLEQNYQGFQIPLQVGSNVIDFKALNQGTSGPNTAAFKVYDDAGNLISSNQWELATGAKATIVIAKAK